LNKVEEFISSK